MVYCVSLADIIELLVGGYHRIVAIEHILNIKLHMD